MHNKSIMFVSTHGDPWGGSEELWSQTALNLVTRGYVVTASVEGHFPPHSRVAALLQGGIDVRPRASRYPFQKRVWRKLTFRRDDYLVAEVQTLINEKRPSLVVFSHGGVISPVEVLELAIANKLPFVTIGQANTENWWPEDERAERYRKALPAASCCYFVSRANLRLFEKQVGYELSNAEVVRNPFNVKFHASPPWPKIANDEVLFACVGRLHPISKGQDILLESLAAPVWADRHWRLTLYGDGPMKDSIQRIVQRLGLGARVIFAGHVAMVEDIWASNQVLVMPSRCEGLPLAMVEAMLCGRPIIATDVAGNSEIIEDGVTGFLAEAPTVSCMSRALENFWTRRTEIEDMGRIGRERIRQMIPADPIAEFSNKINGFIESL